MNILRKLYNWTLSKASHKKASWFLILVSFAESSVFPIPPDILLIPMILAKRLKAWWYAFICTVSSVLGGIVGYYIGYFFYATVGIIIIKFYSLESKIVTEKQRYFYLKHDMGVWRNW